LSKADIIIDWTANVFKTPGGSNIYPDGGIPDPEKYSGSKMIARFMQSLAEHGNLEDPDGKTIAEGPVHFVNANEGLAMHLRSVRRSTILAFTVPSTFPRGSACTRPSCHQCSMMLS